MKKALITLLFLCSALGAFAQRLSVVAVFPFEASGSGASAADAAAVTGQLINELQSWGTLNIVSEDQAGSAEYLIRGRLTRQNNQMIVNAVTYDAKTNKALNSSKEQAASVSALSSQIFSLCAQVTENIPFPNYLLGKWRAVINMIDGPLTCILEFRSNRTVLVEQYDTWEYRGGDRSLRYQGFGTGTYSYWGHVRRTVQGSPIDGFVTINLKLEDALPKYEALSLTRLNLFFDEEKNNFELVSAGFSCGDNFAGALVYPQSAVSYTQFTKIQ
jgi:TolB-like protein